MFFHKQYKHILVLFLLFFSFPFVSAQEEANPFSSISELIQDLGVGIGQLVSLDDIDKKEQLLFFRAVFFFAVFTAFYMGGQIVFKDLGAQGRKYAGILAFIVSIIPSILTPDSFIDPLAGSLTLFVMSFAFLGVISIPIYVMFSFLPKIVPNETLLSGFRFIISVVSIFVTSMFSTAVMEETSSPQVNEGLLSVISTLPGLLLIVFLVIAFWSGGSLIRQIGVGKKHKVSDKQFENTPGMIQEGLGKTKNTMKDLWNKSKEGASSIKDNTKDAFNNRSDARNWEKTQKKRQQRDKKAMKDIDKQEKDVAKKEGEAVKAEEKLEEDVSKLELCFIAILSAIQDSHAEGALSAFNNSKKVSIGGKQSKVYQDHPGLPILFKDMNKQIRTLGKDIRTIFQDLETEERDLEVILEDAREQIRKDMIDSMVKNAIKKDSSSLEDLLSNIDTALELKLSLTSSLRSMVETRNNLQSVSTNIKELLEAENYNAAEELADDALILVKNLEQKEETIRNSLFAISQSLTS